MNKFFFFFCSLLFVSSVLSAQDAIPGASLMHTAGIPTAVVDGVNVMTGDYMEARRDMSIGGAFPLHLDTFYNSSNYHFDSLLVAWRHNHQGIGFVSVDATEWIGDGCQAVYREPSGSTTHYVAKYPKNAKHDIDIKMVLWMEKNIGLTNCYDQIGGHTNYRNTTFVVSKSKRHLKGISGTTCSGSKLVLEFMDGHKDHELAAGLWSKRFRPMTELYPDGHQIHYSYDDTTNKERVIKVMTTDRNQQPLSWFTFAYEQMEKSPVIQIESDDGRNVRYAFTNISNGGPVSLWLLTEKTRSDGPTETYKYDKSDTPMPLLSSCAFPDGRYTLIDYYKKQPKQDERIAHRVHTLKAPVGHDDAPITIRTFDYAFNKDGGGTTTVTNALGQITKYQYTKDYLLTTIVRYEGLTPYSIERLTWGAKNSPDATHLLSKNIHDKHDRLILSHNYSYDDKGNIKTETWAGNLTGTTHSPYHLEHYQKQYTYSKDDYHLLTSETDGHKQIRYLYEKDSNRLIAKFTCEDQQIRKREFFTYNHQDILIQTLIDDGITENPQDLPLTERQIITITPKSQMPHIGLPEVVETRYLDLSTHQEILLTKVINHYSPHGKLVQQDHYDNTNQLAYTLQWEYDTHGNITMQQDPLGNTQTRTYDTNNNLLSQQDSQQTKKFTYDLMNRLITEEDDHLITTHQYDLLGNRISTTDPYNQTTYYTYNALNQLIQIQHPPIPDSQGNLQTPTETLEYDNLGYLSAKTDSLGNRTQTTYTIRGTPIHIQYPDGTSESSTYTPAGLLSTHTSRAGITTTYTYDYQNRIIKEVTSSPDATLKTTTHTYNTFHLLSTTDPSGTTTYTYDSAGRLSTTTNGTLRGFLQP